VALLAAIAVAGLFVALLARGGGRASAAGVSADAQLPTAGDSFEADLGLPATELVAIGASPGEAPGETWAFGTLGAMPVSVEGHAYDNQYALLERSDSSPAWHIVALPPGAEGRPLAPAGQDNGPAAYGSLGGRVTQAGGIVLLSGEDIVVRDPGGKPRLVAQPVEASLLAADESLLPKGPSGHVTVPYAAIEEEQSRTGVLIAPQHDGGKTGTGGEPEAQPGVLHYDGSQWTREPIEASGAERQHFTALALDCSGTQQASAASSPENCWLLAGHGSGGGEPEHLTLFRRVRAGGASSSWRWQPQPVSDWLLGEAKPPGGVSQISVAPLPQGAQMLTATAQGAWVDFRVRVNGEASWVDASELVLAPGAGASPGAPAQVAGTWCHLTGLGAWPAAICPEQATLGASLPERYRSFAWPGSSASDPGMRVITGLPGRAMLELAGGSFSYTVGAGGGVGYDPGGAALYRSSPQGPLEGWIADGVSKEDAGADGEGQSQAIRLTPQPQGDQLQPQGDELQQESVPFRRPLLALAQAPGSSPGNPHAEAIAVGVQGQIGRYVPGEGWRAESLYDSGGRVQTPTLRGVAWPEAGRSYAVGDEGAMWLWRSDTGLWEPDPAKPLNFIGNLTAVAFAPGSPQLGYAVGKQGVLLKYNKSWEQVPLPPELQQVNFTSVAFAGGEAIATYRKIDVEQGGGTIEAGGIAVEEDGSGEHWHVDPGASALLATLPSVGDTVLSKVAGLPDGGAVAGGPGLVIERDAPGLPWRLSPFPLPEAQNVSALAAYREVGGALRAVVSIELDPALDPGRGGATSAGGEGPFASDVPIPSGPGQPPPFIAPDPLPDTGYVLKETASGWSDMEHAALPVEAGQADMPVRPDPVLALLVDPSGAQGIAVGGQTYDEGGRGPEAEAETAAAMRFPAGAAGQDGAGAAPVATPAGQASFVVAGRAACVKPCVDFANESLGPDVWLTHALQTAGQIAGAPGGGLRSFLYTGGRLPGDALVSTSVGGAGLGAEEFERELDRYAQLLGSAGSSLPVYAASSSDAEPPGVGSAPFTRTIVPAGVTPGPERTGAYSVISSGSSGGKVRVIVIDSSSGEVGVTQREWLERELNEAQSERQPAIVLGSGSLGFKLPDAIAPEVLRDGEAVARILVQHDASAYLFDYPSNNVSAQVTYAGSSIPAYGTGTLGYVQMGGFQRDRLGSSGFLLLSVDTSGRNAEYCESLHLPAECTAVPVSAQVVPNIGQLSIDATDGTLLRRSQVAQFEALARRPLAGMEVGGGNGKGGDLVYPSVYDPIPSLCQGPSCAYEVPIDYTFSSSNPDIGNFVAHDPTSSNPRQVLLGENKLPINDSHSGLFCAFNEGTTVISITTGGLTYSEPVTVQGGSVEYPCGTVPLKNPPVLPASASSGFALPNTAPAGPAPVTPQIQGLVPPPAPGRPQVRPAHQAPPPPVALPHALATLFPVPVLVPPPAPSLARPTPPSGTAEVPSQSPVSQQVSVAEREHEEENAIEGVHNMAAYEHVDSEPLPAWPLGLLPIAVAAAVALRPRRSRHDPAYVRTRSRGSPSR
jgi:hypothetical protein